jgi:DNA-binding response OmpR family regulator
MAFSDTAQAALISRQFRRHGWEVHLASSGKEARRLTQALAPELVLLDTSLREESGWLTCAKLLLERPGQQVILVSDEPTAEEERFARFLNVKALMRNDSALPQAVQETVRAALSAAV